MTTLLRRRIAILTAISSTALAYAIGFSTPVLNGVTLVALLVLGAGTFTAYRVQFLTEATEAPVEQTTDPETAVLPQHRQAA